MHFEDISNVLVAPREIDAIGAPETILSLSSACHPRDKSPFVYLFTNTEFNFVLRNMFSGFIRFFRLEGQSLFGQCLILPSWYGLGDSRKQDLLFTCLKYLLSLSSSKSSRKNCWVRKFS